MSSRIALALLLATPFAAWGNPPGCPDLTYDPYPVKTVHITKTYEAGNASTKENTDGPAPEDYPPNTTLTLHNSAVSKDVDDSTVEIYNLTKVYSAPHKTIQPQLKLLKKLLAERPTTLPKDKDSGNGVELDLPDYPSSDCAHLFQGKLHYVDMPWGSGLGYITVFCQDVSPPTNQGLCYVFMGLSKDGKYMVSAMLHLTHPKLINSFDDLPKSAQNTDGINAFNAKTIPFLSAEPDSAFNPTIGELEKWIADLKFS